ncbi:acetyltransferase, GNAT family [Labilithrix luteola]|uniref:Acetyltransferase, GNAT family n=1 Tax=Labilithrix luteola TaxID=1391654 RepID=A0A0K1Q323_9BACT|nr:GNAT family N-acetyltransferase [Labilithrix luteola]AKV00118.1 acetyltransferase, GNAT family [Labilithrix luteola]
MHIRDIEPADLPALLALNNDHAAEVNALTHEALARLVAIAASARTIDGGGFLVAFDEKTPAQGPNHAWFIERQPAFLYVDRVVIMAQARGRGLARRLYEDLASVAAARPLCCEVNLEPPNAASLAFHERLGFAPCGEAIDPRNGKRVRYLLRAA